MEGGADAVSRAFEPPPIEDYVGSYIAELLEEVEKRAATIHGAGLAGYPVGQWAHQARQLADMATELAALIESTSSDEQWNTRREQGR